MNTKTTKVYGYTPAQIILGFEPKHYYFDIEPLPLPAIKLVEQPLPDHQYQLLAALRDENRLLSSEVASYSHHYHKLAQQRQRIPEPGDLVLVRNHQVDNQRGRKLEARWLGPRLLVKWTHHRRSGWIRELHGTATPKRYHIDDIILYHKRRPVFSGRILLTTPAVGSTPVCQSAYRFQPSQAGQRALRL